MAAPSPASARATGRSWTGTATVSPTGVATEVPDRVGVQPVASLSVTAFAPPRSPPTCAVVACVDTNSVSGAGSVTDVDRTRGQPSASITISDQSAAQGPEADGDVLPSSHRQANPAAPPLTVAVDAPSQTPPQVAGVVAKTIERGGGSTTTAKAGA